MNYSQKVLFDDWINKCPIDNVQVQEPTSMVRSEFGKWDYLIKVFLTIDKDDWENNSRKDKNPGNFKNFEKLPFEDDLQSPSSEG